MGNAFSRLEMELGQGRVRPWYVLAGDDRYVLQRAEGLIIEAVLPPRERGFNLNLCTWGEVSPEEVVRLSRTLPFMASRRVVVVREAGEVLKGVPSALGGYLLRPTPSTVLVFVAPGRHRPPRGLEEGFYDLTPSRRDVSYWVTRIGRERGVELTPGAISLLREVVGDDLMALSQEVEKLALYKSGTRVDEGDIQEVVADVRLRSVFELVEAVEAGELERALDVLERLWRHGEPSPKILGALAWGIRERIKRGGRGRLPEALKVLQQVDVALKRRGSSRWLLEGLLLELL